MLQDLGEREGFAASDVSKHEAGGKDRAMLSYIGGKRGAQPAGRASHAETRAGRARGRGG